MSDIVILKALEQRGRWQTLRHLVPVDMLVPDARALLAWYDVYFKTYTEQEELNHDNLLALIKTRVQLTQEQWIPLKLAVDRLRNFTDTEAIKGIVNNLLERDLSGRAGALIAAYNEGKEVDLIYELTRLGERTKRSVESSNAGSFIDTDIATLLAEEELDYGLKLPTTLLSESIKGLVGGATIAVGARPDKGKSSFLAAVLTHFAPQMDDYFEAGRPLLWLNNEGSGKRIIPRIYQAALKKTTTDIIQMAQAGTLVPAYTKAMRGDLHRIRVKDMHGASLAQIEQVVEAMNPAVVVFDMVANFRLGSNVNGGNKTDEIEAKWQTIREMAVRHDFVAIGTIQVSADGDDQLFPPYSALKDSKTGVQGAVDIILMLGALNSPEMQTIRGLSTPKNKFAIAGKQSYVQGEVVFDAPRCVFTDGV